MFSSLFAFFQSNVTRAVIIIWAAVCLVFRYVLGKRDQKIRGRRMSCMTEMMACGTFPPAAGDVHYAVTVACFYKVLPDLEQIKQNVSDVLMFYKRFRSVPQAPFWREVEVQIDDHVHPVDVDSQKDLDEQLQVIMNRPLPPDRPRWEFVVIRNRECSSSFSHYVPSRTAKTSPPYHAILIRADHTIGDGISFVEVFTKLATDFDGNPVADVASLVGLKRNPPKRRTIARFFIETRVFSTVTKILRMIKTIIRVIKGIPASLAGAMGQFDTETSFTATTEQKRRGLIFSREQRLAMGGPWSLEFIKAIKTKLGVSVNDLFMAAFAGAIRRYCIDAGDSAFTAASSNKQTILCRALLPFAFLRNPKVFRDPEAALSNNWTLISTELAVNEESRLNRVKAVNKIMTAVKRKLRPLSSVLISTIGCHVLPRRWFQQTVYDLYNRHSVVFANVPGPAVKIRCCGAVIEGMQILFCGALPQVEVFSYAGGIYFNIVCDPKIITQPDKIVQYFGEELRNFGSDIGISEQHRLECQEAPETPSKYLLTQSEMSLDSSAGESYTESDRTPTEKKKRK